MAETTQIFSEDQLTSNETPIPSNNTTDEQTRALLNLLGRHKSNPEYLERVFGAAQKAREQINAEELRALKEKGK